MAKCTSICCRDRKFSPTRRRSAHCLPLCMCACAPFYGTSCAPISFLAPSPCKPLRASHLPFPSFREIRQLLAHASIGTPISYHLISCVLMPILNPGGASELFWLFVFCWFCCCCCCCCLIFHFALLTFVFVFARGHIYLFCCTYVFCIDKRMFGSAISCLLCRLSNNIPAPPQKKTGLSLNGWNFVVLLFLFLFLPCVCVFVSWLGFYSLFPQWLVHFKFIDFRTL